MSTTNQGETKDHAKLCCIPSLDVKRLKEDYDEALNSSDGTAAFNCQYEKKQGLRVTTSKELPSSNGHRATPGSTTQGFAKCLDCYSKYVKKYAPVCPQFQTTLFELTKKKPADEEDVCWYLREAMNRVKKTPPPNGENCEDFETGICL